MKDGLYAVSFAVGSDSGGGVVTVQDGRVAGGDAGFAYVGTISGRDGSLLGEFEVFQHEPGFPSVFAGLTNFKLTGAGTAQGDNAHFRATTPSAPGVQLDVVLRYLRSL